MRTTAKVLLLLVLVPLVISGCGENTRPGTSRVMPDPKHPGRYRCFFEAMNTDGAIQVAAPDIKSAREMISRAVDRLRMCERRMNMFRPQSELSRLNKQGASRPVKLSPLTLEVLREARRMNRLTDGTFDVTYAPLRALWQRAQERERPPTPGEIQDVLGRVGTDKLVLTGSTARFEVKGMRVDLGGIAKGFAIDEIVATLEEAGAQSALVDIGGDIRLLGQRGDGEEWKIQVRDPRPGDHSPIMLRLADVAVATSGDYARFFRIGDEKFSHIIDPRTGRPTRRVFSTTVVAPRALTADALATAVSVLGPNRALKLINGLPEVECMIMTHGDKKSEGPGRLQFSRGWNTLVESGDEDE